MKVAFCIRPTWNTPLGGDGVQMLSTKKYLEELYGVEVDVVIDPQQLSCIYDIIHVFNFSTIAYTEIFIDKADELNIPVVSSSIFWDYTYSTLFTNLLISSHISQMRAQLIKSLVNLCSKICGFPRIKSNVFRTKFLKFCNNSILILPNSKEEGYLLQEFVKKDISSKIRVVYNGTDIKQGEIVEEEEFFKKYQIPREFILQVGRIEPIKNQINLVYALKDNVEIPIVFVGKMSDMSYAKKLRKLSKLRGNVYFINAVPHEDIGSFYHYARVHVLLSLRESPGLVSLEALQNNCPIVISSEKFTPINTYFSNQPYITNPFDLDNIKAVVLQAYHERKVIKEQLDMFTWKVAAKQTFDAYQEALRLLNK